MNNDWAELSINTTTIVSELLSEFLLQEGAKGVVLGEWDPDNISEYTTLKAYYPEEIPNFKELLLKINEKLLSYQKSGLITGAGEISVKLVKEEDWANSWKKYFHTLRIGKNLVIKPLWEEYQVHGTDIVINFDPGMAFGTGTHPSTQLCMEEIEKLAEKIPDKESFTVLDLGTGSGILAITLNLLGFKKITAVDIDPVAIKASKENFKINNLNINLFQGELKDCNSTFDFIAGNLLAEIIESIANDLYKKLNKEGIFLGSGIIKQKEKDVISSLLASGFIIKDTRYLGDWAMILAKKT